MSPCEKIHGRWIPRPDDLKRERAARRLTLACRDDPTACVRAPISRPIPISGGALAPRLSLPPKSAFDQPAPPQFVECGQPSAAPADYRHTEPAAEAVEAISAPAAITDTVQERRGCGSAGVPSYSRK